MKVLENQKNKLPLCSVWEVRITILLVYFDSILLYYIVTLILQWISKVLLHKWLDKDVHIHSFKNNDKMW